MGITDDEVRKKKQGYIQKETEEYTVTEERGVLREIKLLYRKREL